MWMLSPGKMCAQHIRGEHYELHKLVGAIRADRLASVRGLAREGYIYTPRLRERHAELEAAGGWSSPLPDVDLPTLGEPINRERARADLIERCGECRELILQ